MSKNVSMSAQKDFRLGNNTSIRRPSPIGGTKENIAEIERMIKAPMRSLENKLLNPFLQVDWRRTNRLNLKKAAYFTA
jgi:hypothetical protein